MLCRVVAELWRASALQRPGQLRDRHPRREPRFHSPVIADFSAFFSEFLGSVGQQPQLPQSDN
jgi:hypothetical protein